MRSEHFVLGGVLLLAALTLSPPEVRANLPLGACCLANGVCEDLMVTQCEGLGGDFIGEDTSCSTIDCAAPVVAPMLSIFGLVAIVGALGGLGAYRLLLRRHRGP